MERQSTHTEILIIGAGPGGLLAALVLRLMKVKVRIVDRRLPYEVSGQAGGIQPRMLEIWENLGIGRDLRDRSEHVHRMVTHFCFEFQDSLSLKLPSKLASQMLNIPVPSARYQYEVLARIDIIEQILQERLKAEGVVVERPGVPISLTVETQASDSYPVKVEVAWLNEKVLRDHNVAQDARGDPESIGGLVDKFECIAAKFVIGCDGGKSWTRKQLNIAMKGNQTELHWGILDFTPKTNFPTPRAKNIIQSPLAGALGYLPRPAGAARVYVMLDEKQIVSADECKNVIADKLRRGFAPYEMEIEETTWCTVFSASQRVAERFSGHGRIFIAGDACHTHSSKAGQGANAAMSDTFNLAWKIGYVVQKRAKPDILETYEQERRPYSLELIELDRKIFRLFDNHRFTPEEYTSLWHEQIIFASGIGLCYSSALIDGSGQWLAPKLRIGERISSLEVIRSNDWRPVNLHDLCRFNGKFRLFVLPGNILESSRVDRLCAFSRRYMTLMDRIKEMAETYIITDNDSSLVVESIPLPLTLVGGCRER
ncbi:FAD binding domain-containing protein [Mycena galopus ATCC 62051]|nr:FAD binding domain-containing protein [Mycena galopus ATCC 62051]